MSVDVRSLRAFLVVAQELHFGRAAERLNTAQPALSRTIARLESALEVRLFDRSSRAVRLTAAGKSLMEEAREIVERIDGLPQRVLNAASGHRPLLIAYMDFAMNAYVPSIVKPFKQRYPEYPVHLTSMGTEQQRLALLEGEIDAGFLIGPFEHRGIATLTIGLDPLVVLLPKTHRLAEKSEVHLSDLVLEDFVLGSKEAWGAYRRMLDDLCLEAGFAPRVIQEASNATGIFGMVAAGMGVAIHAGTARLYSTGEVELRPLISGSKGVTTLLAWRRAAQLPILSAFLDTVHQQIGRLKDPPAEPPQAVASTG